MNRLHYASTRDADMLYLAQYHIADPFFFLETGGKKYVFLSMLDIGAFREYGNREVEAVDVGPFLREAQKRPGNLLGNLALVVLEKYNVTRDIHIPASFPTGIADILRQKLLRYIVVTDFCPERLIKSEAEIAHIRENFVHTKKAYEYIESVLQESEIDADRLMYRGTVLTSEFLKREVGKLLLDYDLVNPEGMIISSGFDTAKPHHSGSGPIRPGQPIIVDIFPQSTKNQYFADMTRTYVKGMPLRKEIIKMYEAVAASQKNAMKSLRPGVECKMPYEISAGIIERAGFDVGEKGYIHSLGHGLGVAVHEAPSLSVRSEMKLQEGMVVTVEPGLYYEDIGGVRIEDTVVITKDGFENLTDYPQNWLL